MDERAIGLKIRALRRRLGWRQIDLARVAGVSQSTISKVERGHLGQLTVSTLKQIIHALDASLQMDLRWRGAQMDRLMDERHAGLSAAVIAELTAMGWECRAEVSYSRFGERGSIDILAWHAETGTLLVIEIKTELVSGEATLRKLDEKGRLAGITARERFGWRAKTVGTLVVVAENSTDRRRVERHAALFDAALPIRGHAVRRWLRAPVGGLHGLWFLSVTPGQSGKPLGRSPDRIRVPKGTRATPRMSVAAHGSGARPP